MTAHEAAQLTFGRFRLDLATQCLWRGRTAISLSPKVFAVLSLLIERAGTLVSKDELRQAVWDDPLASDASVKVCIGDLRKLLGDQPQKPKLIETVHRRGYRFIATVSEAPAGSTRKRRAESCLEASVNRSADAGTPLLVGRERELAQLDRCLEQSVRGNRQVIFVTGEPGIGKTSLVAALLAQVDAHRRAWIACGQCLQHHYTCEAYRPVLEAFGRLALLPGRARLVSILARYAPTWLRQLPAIHKSRERDGFGTPKTNLVHAPLATSPARMLREFEDALTALTAETPLVLVLDDLHCCDDATLDLIAALARRRDRARLMLIGVYRPADAVLNRSPMRTLKQDLQAHGQCRQLALECLSGAAVRAYFEIRFPAHRFPCELPELIHQHTDGHPLLMVELVQYLQDHQFFAEIDGRWTLCRTIPEIGSELPESIRSLIAQQIDPLDPDDRRLLCTAAIQGLEFDAAVVAESGGMDTASVEERLEVLDRERGLVRLVNEREFPDRTLTRRYRFVYVLYQKTFYASLAPARRAGLSAAVAQALLAHHENEGSAIAAELAKLYEAARDHLRAADFCLQAAQNASQMCAERDAVLLAQRGLALLARVHETPERTELHRRLQLALDAYGKRVVPVPATESREAGLCGVG